MVPSKTDEDFHLSRGPQTPGCGGPRSRVNIMAMDTNSGSDDGSKEKVPALAEEVNRLRAKLQKDYPDATSTQLETAIGNALKATDQSLDEERVEQIARRHLGSP